YPKDELVNQIEIVRGLGLASRNTVQGSNESIPVEETSQSPSATMQEDEVINYPNPFNPSTVISYKLQAASRVTLKVYDVLGREVAVLVDEFKNAGNYKITFNVKTRHGVSLQSGVYFYRLTTPTNTITKKMLLIK
ncbi:MAG: T9SS type A sorting domain-containing protein, partial [Bacteroidota bacterium]